MGHNHPPYHPPIIEKIIVGGDYIPTRRELRDKKRWRLHTPYEMRSIKEYELNRDRRRTIEKEGSKLKKKK